MVLDRDQDPRSRGQAPFEHRFYALLRSELRPSRPALSALSALLSLACVWLFSPRDWVSPWGYVGAAAFILAVHDLGHALAARAHGIELGPPLWLPFPGLGTLGSILQSRAPFKTRRDLFDVALAGPLATLVTSMLFLRWGFDAEGFVRLPTGGEPRFLNSILARFLAAGAPELPAGYDYQGSHVLHAGRLGLALTFLNFLPGGWFDGALLGRAAARRRDVWWARGAAAGLALVAAVSQDAWWLLWAGACLVPVRRVPPPLNPFLGLGTLRWIVAAVALVLAVFSAASPRALFSGW